MRDAIRIRRLASFDHREIEGLCDVLIDCVEGGASVSFMLPMSRAKAESFWRDTAASVERGERVVLVAEDAAGSIVGTVQVIWAQPENQPHRGDLAKMLVHRRARRQGVGAALLEAAEKSALASGQDSAGARHRVGRCRALVRETGLAALRRDSRLRADARRCAVRHHHLLQVPARLKQRRAATAVAAAPLDRQRNTRNQRSKIFFTVGVSRPRRH